ncbi:MAG: hypothetical protein D6707_07895 [Bacteroidetes bacterium]|nr:MAG: hypothetical protein D6707_07895 [Bacteroidota bacterium]
MKCKEFEEILNQAMDAGHWQLSQKAEKHREDCQHCQEFYHSMIQLKNNLQQFPTPELSPSALRILSLNVLKKIRTTESRTKGIEVLRDFFSSLRWERLLVTASLLLIGIFLAWKFFVTDMRHNHLQTENDLEILMEEHALATENSIFYSTTAYTNVIAARERK